MTAAIAFEEVSKRYRLGSRSTSLREAIRGGLMWNRSGRDNKEEIWALKEASFSVDRGVALGIVGENGAGKTTILKLVAEITFPDSGSVKSRGRVASLLELGAGFHPDLTGKENLELNAAVLGMPIRRIRERYEEIVAFSGLRDFMDTPIKRYSSGMYARLGFSVAAFLEPEILLVDEVLAVGDSLFRQKCVKKIHELKEKGTTILFVSHNMNLVRSVCDKGIFLEDGCCHETVSVVDAIREYEKHLRSKESAHIGPLNVATVIQEEEAAVTLQEVRLSAHAEEGLPELMPTDPLSVSVSYRSNQPVANPTVVGRLVRSDGLVCCEIRSRDQGIWLDAEGGEGSFTFTLNPVQLSSGVYIFEIALHDETDAVPLGSGHSEWFRVVGTGVTLSHDYTGVFVPRVEWDV